MGCNAYGKAINIEHPFGLPIWKPALYRKSRSVTRNAESALHALPSAAAERHLLPGNLLWAVLFGWWMAIICLVVAIFVSFAEVFGGGRGGYGKMLLGLAWYLGWPFGKYVEGEGGPEDSEDHKDDQDDSTSTSGPDAGYGSLSNGIPVGNERDVSGVSASSGTSSNITVRDNRQGSVTDRPRPTPAISTDSAATIQPRQPTITFAPTIVSKASNSLHHLEEHLPLLKKQPAFRRPRNRKARFFGHLAYWPLFLLILAPLMTFVSLLCWGGVITIPMAKLNWALVKLLYLRPLEINFRSAPKMAIRSPTLEATSSNETDESAQSNAESSRNTSSSTTAVEASGTASPGYTIKQARLSQGQIAPTEGPTSTVLLCVYRAVGLQYYKYTIGGVNIIFINLLPLVFFTIIDAFLILPAAEASDNVSPFVRLISSRALIFVLSLASVIPLSYFIGMAVASISAQSSIGMGAVINATFGSIIEIILYGIALTQGKGRLVEGSIVGSILAGVLLMPGASMCSGALKRKEQKFNAKSAGVTSTMLIMAIIGTLTPTMFYQTYGSVSHVSQVYGADGSSNCIAKDVQEAHLCH